MEIFLTDHLRSKMAERRIAYGRVAATINHPDFTRPTYHSREERYKKFNKNYLMVVVRAESNTMVVITTHWVGRLPKE